MTTLLRSISAPYAALVLLAMAACSPNSLVDVQAPGTVVDPTVITTVSGAIQLHDAAVAKFTQPLAGANDNNVIVVGGLFTDELTEANGSFVDGPDQRRINDPTFGTHAGTQLYTVLHQARIQAQMARQALELYAPNAPSAPAAWRGQLFALEGYTVLWFAENFCSGIPLTSVPLVGATVPTKGFTTQELYTRAIALFDSAIVAGADSAQFVNLARVGKGRALLGLGQFADADAAVQAVPSDFVYSVQFTQSGQYTNQVSSYGFFYLRVQDNEGTNGLVWSTDPRTVIVTSPTTGAMLRPAKYFVSSGVPQPDIPQPGSPVRLADGLEASLIHAEAALAVGDPSWLTTLNMLRRTCVGTAACAPVPGLTAANLPDTLTDPGNDAARVNLLFAERAKWLYLTGHRQGDLRRLAHVYHRDQETVWPTGVIVSPAFPPGSYAPLAENGTHYGADVVFGPDPNERSANSLYSGCYDYNP